MVNIKLSMTRIQMLRNESVTAANCWACSTNFNQHLPYHFELINNPGKAICAPCALRFGFTMSEDLLLELSDNAWKVANFGVHERKN